MSQKIEWGRDKTAKLLDITPRHLNYLAQNGIIPKAEGGEWPAFKCLTLYIRYLRDGGNANSKDDKARKIKADADTAEMEAETMRGTLCLRSDFLNNYKDAVAQGVSKISRLKTLTTAQKSAVFTALREVTLRPLEVAKETAVEESDDVDGSES